MKRSVALMAGLVAAVAVCAGCSQGRIGGPEDAGADAADGAGVDAGGDSGPDAGADPGADAGGDSGGDTTIDGWLPVGLSGGGGMFAPSISAVDPDLMMINCDMSGSYVSEDGGHWWRLIHFKQRQSYLPCPVAFHSQDSNVILAPQWDRLKISHDRGRSWEDWSDLGANAYGQIVYDPDDPDLVVAGTADGCRISRDSALSWTSCAGPAGEALAVHFDRTSSSQARVIFVATREGIWRSDDGGVGWTRKTAGLPDGGTPINDFAGGSDPASGRVMLYCTVPSRIEGGLFAGGVFRSADRGENWQWAMGQGINKDTQQYDQWAAGSIPTYTWVLTSDTAPLTVYTTNSSTGFWPPHDENVWRSDDGGDSWRETFFMDPRSDEYNVAPNYVTASMGQSFKGGDPPFGASICRTDPERVLIEWSKCYITHDGGASWFNGHTFPPPGVEPGPGTAWVNNGLVVTTTWHYYIDPHELERHYIAYTDLGFARSTDGGDRWIWWDKQGQAPWHNTCYEMAFDPDVAGKVWGAFSEVHDIPNANIIHNRHWGGNPESGGGGVALSTDFGRSWQEDNDTLPEAPVTSIVLDPNSQTGSRTVYAGVFGRGVYRSEDDGQSWTSISNGLGDPANMRVYRVVLHADGTLFALITARMVDDAFKPEGVGLYRSGDGGASWTRITTDPLLLWPKDFQVDPGDSDTIFVGAADAGNEQGGLWRTRDGGASWQRVARFGREHFGAYFHPQRPGWVYATMCEGTPEWALWLSTDGGDNWEPFESFPFANTQRVQFDPADPDVIYVTTFGASVLKGPARPGG
ncbi:MAG TPA: hypothetical protein VM425_16340 [Myxococcota bacterium]|nr:hypothetical protein [Myxococcota bacterium]